MIDIQIWIRNIFCAVVSGVILKIISEVWPSIKSDWMRALTVVAMALIPLVLWLGNSMTYFHSVTWLDISKIVSWVQALVFVGLISAACILWLLMRDLQTLKKHVEHLLQQAEDRQARSTPSTPP